MEHFAGLDVSVKETSVCIVDDTARLFVKRRWRANLKRLAALVAKGADVSQYFATVDCWISSTRRSGGPVWLSLICER